MGMSIGGTTAGGGTSSGSGSNNIQQGTQATSEGTAANVTRSIVTKYDPNEFIAMAQEWSRIIVDEEHDDPTAVQSIHERVLDMDEDDQFLFSHYVTQNLTKNTDHDLEGATELMAAASHIIGCNCGITPAQDPDAVT